MNGKGILLVALVGLALVGSVVAGSIVLGEVTRYGTHANDNYVGIAYCPGVEIEYTADS